MEQKLAEFRARKKVEKQATKNENPPESCFCETQTAPNDATKSTESNTTVKEENRDWLLDSAVGRWLGVQRLAVTNLTLLKVLLWLVLLGLFTELDFGLPFFVLSLFYWLYEGLRSPVARKPGELSAYSVFNPNCQPILGTLTAEQLEGEMGYRPLNNRVNT
ncbi:SAYSvFN domain-containing protein 1 [Tachysurus fulvidraco]|uniref:SAYSvFN domain-containing protein 1 n=1 Tax=Tachysurus fulvidraco TaxID=1234273 RepID=UPI000F4FCA8B|nr:SAYSvFN domain-containing protein 1 [Tachysurus fulvidraco]XP_047657954.1 SAYSvFN domain-containing protein 1 [Tachysurus fulvidraco]